MKINISARRQFAREGRVWVRNAISGTDLMHFDAATNLQSKAGFRVDFTDSLMNALSDNGSLRRAVASIDPQARPVRVVAFNKSKSTNWGVPWHQDRVISVAEKHDVKGFKNWTQKAGIWHCEPPQELLNEMLFVRVHLDETDSSNGAMQISLGSHVNGIVPSQNAETCALQNPIESCDAARGDVLIMQMLTLHASKPSDIATQRRVFRIDFASFDLPAPLAWAV